MEVGGGCREVVGRKLVGRDSEIRVGGGDV